MGKSSQGKKHKFANFLYVPEAFERPLFQPTDGWSEINIAQVVQFLIF